MQNTNSVVVVLGTGGTIAGTAAAGAPDSSYRAAQLGVAELLVAVPSLSPPIECEQVAQLDSKDMGFAVWMALAERIRHHLARPEVAGVVVTHGTDTLEETAYFLHRVLAPFKPVVLTAAMRPATSAEADGPRNLHDAVTVARHPGAQGVVAVVAGQVFAAADVRKVHPTRLNAFGAGEAGALADVDEQGLRSHRPWTQEPVTQSIIPWTDTARWPRVELVFSHAGADGAVVRALTATPVDGSPPVQGLVVACTGNGSLHHALEAALLEAQAAGVRVWRSTQCTEGEVVPRPTDHFASTGRLTPVKARIALMLDLMAHPLTV